MTKEKYHIEFVMGTASQSSLWRMISQPEGLQKWFANEVSKVEDIYTFSWERSSEEAELIHIKPKSIIRYRWLDEDDESYFEFRIHKLELSRELALEITDFAEPEDKGDAIALWETQVERMMRKLGV